MKKTIESPHVKDISVHVSHWIRSIINKYPNAEFVDEEELQDDDGKYYIKFNIEV